MSNISGSTQRKIHAAINSVVSAKLATLDARTGDHIIANLDRLQDMLEEPLKKAIDTLIRELNAKLVLVNNNIVLEAIGSRGATSLSSYHLNMQDHSNISIREVKAELPAGHVFEDRELSVRVAQLISRQPKGEEGDLITYGYANMFFLPEQVMYVAWRPSRQDWEITCTSVDDDYNFGRRVFVPN